MTFVSVQPHSSVHLQHSSFMLADVEYVNSPYQLSQNGFQLAAQFIGKPIID